MLTQWENIQLKVSGGGPTALSDTLNKMGGEGWEAWHMESRPDHVILFMKRPRQAPSFVVSPELQECIKNGRRG